jgi:hypothetical protein
VRRLMNSSAATSGLERPAMVVDGEQVGVGLGGHASQADKGFRVVGGEDVSAHGGWRAYRRASAQAPT